MTSPLTPPVWPFWLPESPKWLRALSSPSVIYQWAPSKRYTIHDWTQRIEHNSQLNTKFFREFHAALSQVIAPKNWMKKHARKNCSAQMYLDRNWGDNEP